jgi:acetyltransferase-like isoleucine patch superfamily enzyme
MTSTLIEAGRHTVVPDDVECNVKLRFGSFCSIASGLIVVSGQHPAVDVPEAISNFPFNEWGWGVYPPSRLDGEVLVGDDVWIGQDVTIMDGVEVGAGAILGAGSVVVNSVPAYTLVAGNPARVRKKRFSDEQIAQLLDVAWWDWPDAEIRRCLPDMADVAVFLSKHFVPVEDRVVDVFHEADTPAR